MYQISSPSSGSIDNAKRLLAIRFRLSACCVDSLLGYLLHLEDGALRDFGSFTLPLPSLFKLSLGTGSDTTLLFSLPLSQ